MRPISGEFQITQDFASLPTRGVVGNLQGSMVQVLVAMYGDYQPDGHAGTDIGCPVGTPVRATRSGTVIYCNWDVNLPGGPNDWASRWFFYQRFGGRLLLVQHAPNDIDVYAHLSDWKVRQGQLINEGDIIALSGDSSAGQDGQLGPHLHTERIVNTSYPTGSGLIYGRTDPTTVWGGLAAQAGRITPLSEEDDMFTDDDRAALIAARNEATNAKNNAADARQVATDARNEATNAKNFALAAIQSNVSLLQTQLPDPQNPKRSYSLAEWIVYGNLKAGGAQQIVSNLTPELIAAAVSKASGDVDAQAIAKAVNDEAAKRMAS